MTHRDAQVQGHQRRVLPGGALPVVAAAHDDAVSRRFGCARERSGSQTSKQNLRQVGDVGAIGQDLRAGGHDVVGGDIVAHLQHQLRRQAVGRGLALGEFA